MRKEAMGFPLTETVFDSLQPSFCDCLALTGKAQGSCTSGGQTQFPAPHCEQTDLSRQSCN